MRLLLFTILFFASSSFASEVTFNDYRESFEFAVVPIASHLTYTKWSCNNVQGFDGFKDETHQLFNFAPVLHNPYMLYNNGVRPVWLPHWFSSYRGLRTTLPIKVNQIFNQQCQSHWFDCAESGDAIEYMVYLREDAEGLILEWTVLNYQGGFERSHSKDPDNRDQRAFMYSRCQKI